MNMKEYFGKTKEALEKACVYKINSLRSKDTCIRKDGCLKEDFWKDTSASLREDYWKAHKAFDEISDLFLDGEQIYDNDRNMVGDPEKVYLYWISLGQKNLIDESTDRGRQKLKKRIKDRGYRDFNLMLKYLAASAIGTVRNAMDLEPIEPWD